MCNAFLDQLEFNSPNATIVHVRRGYAVRSSLGVCDGNVRDTINRELVVEAAVVAQDATMAVRSIFAQADVAGYKELREALAQESDCRNDGPLWIICRSSKVVLYTRSDRDTEEYNRAETLADEGFEERHELVDASAILIGERWDECFLIILVGNEEREDEHGLRAVLVDWLLLPAEGRGVTLVNCLSACHARARG